MLQKTKVRQLEIAAIGIGILLGVLKFMLPLTTFIKVVGGIGITAMILWKVEIGVFITVGLTPFLPTMALAGLVLLNVLSLLIKWFKNPQFSFNYGRLDAFMLLFVGAILYGSLTSYAYKSSIKIALIYIVFISFYIVLVNTVKTRQHVYALVVLIVFSSFIVGLYGIYQNFSGGQTVQSWVDKEMFKDIKARVYSTFDNPNVLGEYLVLLIPLAVAMLWSTKKWLQRAVYGIIAATLLVCIIFTWSRGSWLGVILAMGIFIILKDRRLVVWGIAGALLLPFALPMSIINRFASIGNLKDSSSSYRLSIWLGSLKIIKDYWPSGIGIGSDAFAKIYPKYALSGAAFALHAHNLYLQTLVETGIIGLLSFLLLLLLFYKNILTSCRKTQDCFLSTFMMALCAGMTGYLFQGFVDNIWYNYRMVFIFWTMISLGMTAVQVTDNEQHTDTLDACSTISAVGNGGES